MQGGFRGQGEAYGSVGGEGGCEWNCGEGFAGLGADYEGAVLGVVQAVAHQLRPAGDNKVDPSHIAIHRPAVIPTPPPLRLPLRHLPPRLETPNPPNVNIRVLPAPNNRAPNPPPPFSLVKQPRIPVPPLKILLPDKPEALHSEAPLRDVLHGPRP